MSIHTLPKPTLGTSQLVDKETPNPRWLSTQGGNMETLKKNTLVLDTEGQTSNFVSRYMQLSYLCSIL